LLDWHRDWFASHDPKKSATGRNPVLYQAPGGEWKLTTTERKRILLQNIFGVDIDAQAVETTKLSLLLKVLRRIGTNARHATAFLSRARSARSRQQHQMRQLAHRSRFLRAIGNVVPRRRRTLSY